VSGVVTTVAGQTGIAGSSDGANSQAQFHYPSGVAVDPAGNLYVADTENHTLREIESSGSVSTLAGLAGVSGSADGAGTAARFNFPTGVTINGTSVVYVADTNNHTIRFVGTTVAPTIAVQPQSQTAAAGANVTFLSRPRVARADLPMEMQWHDDHWRHQQFLQPGERSIR